MDERQRLMSENNCSSEGMKYESAVRTYIGTKIIKAKRMSSARFNEEKRIYEESKRTVSEYEKETIPYLRGGLTPRQDHGSEEGYKVFYPDGYISWSPKAVFEQAYREVTQSEKSLM